MAATPASTTVQLPSSYHKALSNRFTSSSLAALTAGKPRSLFFYGSLMLPSQIARIIGCESQISNIAAQMTPATLYAHERLAVRYTQYPAVIASATKASDQDLASASVAKVEGMLILGLDDQEQRYLHWYESGLYDLKRVEVEIEVVERQNEGGVVVEQRAKRMVEAEMYVWGGGVDELVGVEEKEWSLVEAIGELMASGLEIMDEEGEILLLTN